MKITYGYDVQEGKDSFVDLADTAMRHFAATAVPGVFLVDTFPALRFVPKWFPGAAWKKIGAIWRKDTLEMVNTPYEWVKNRMVREWALLPLQMLTLTNIAMSNRNKETACPILLLNCLSRRLSALKESTTSSGLQFLFMQVQCGLNVHDDACELIST